MIYATGDTHIPYDFIKMNKLALDKPELTKNDYVIVAGDFGLIWNWQDTGKAVPANKADTKWTNEELLIKHALDDFPFTTLFVDGNHENFARLSSYPVSEWNGGKVHKITDSIIHLMRGQVYEIDGLSVFTFGGAASTDRGTATGTEDLDEGICWWREELCTQQERDEAVRNLAEAGNSVDLIITHCLPDDLAMRIGFRDFNMTTNFLWNIEEQVNFKLWLCGHYHRDEWIKQNVRALYHDFVSPAEEIQRI